jgi:FAD dependent oxidoreductase
VRQKGARLFAETAVQSAMEEKSWVVVRTDKGTVRATDVVFATNSPIGGSVAVHTKQAPYRTYALAAVLPRGSLPDALYWDTLDPYHYVRLQEKSEGEDFVIVGGQDHKSGQTDDGEARFAALERWARDRLPKMGEVTHRWSGQVMEPADYVGLVGRNAGDKHRYLVTGDSGQGITNGVMASMLITSLIVDRTSRWTEVYDPGHTITRNIAGFLSENLTVLRSFAEYLTAGDVSSVEGLQPGEGGLFRSGLKKIAACRDRRGHLHMHSAACTHMGCVVPLEFARAVLGLSVSRVSVCAGRRSAERARRLAARGNPAAEAPPRSRGVSGRGGDDQRRSGGSMLEFSRLGADSPQKQARSPGNLVLLYAAAPCTGR